jgi:cytochrome c
MPQLKKGRMLFFEKRRSPPGANQKIFNSLMRAAATERDSNQKFFASFFQKRSAFFSYVLLCAMSGPAIAGGVGTPLTPADLANVFAIPPDGTGLPSGEGSVQQGQSVYVEKCAACHGATLQGSKLIGAPALIGGRGTLTTKPLKTVESYWPYATTLFDYIKRAMPMTAPGSLSNDQVYAVSAYILAQAHILPENAVLDAKTLTQIRMPNRQGFVSDWKSGSRP